MKYLLTLILVTLNMMQTFTHSVDSTFHHLVCQQCNVWCLSEENISQPERPPRRGKAGPPGAVEPPGEVGQPGVQGPRGVPGEIGPVGEPGVCNMTSIEEMIDRKIKEAFIRNGGGNTQVRNVPVTSENCRGKSYEQAKSRNETGGIFDINVPEIGIREVYCDVRTDGGDWIVFQRRMDGSVDFYLDWNDYVNGFGNTNGEFWLGLEVIHQLTRNGNFEMRIDMIEMDGTYYYAKYSSFKIEPASDNYRLRANGYSGNATDSFANPSHPDAGANNMAFSTREQDNDRSSRNCAATYKGGWWYNACYWSDLNGLYDERNDEGLKWYYQSGGKDLSLKFTEMKFRLKE